MNFGAFKKMAGDVAKQAAPELLKAGIQQGLKSNPEMLTTAFASQSSDNTDKGFLTMDGLKKAVAYIAKLIGLGQKETEQETQKTVEKAESTLPNINQISLDQFRNLMLSD
jgi:hypothetical protein